MQFSVVAVLAAMASVVAAQSTVTVYACPSSTAAVSAIPSGVATPTAVGTASTGAVIPPTATFSPISYATGAASVNAISGSALGFIVAGGVALLL